MPCIFCDRGICINPDHEVVRTYEHRTSELRMVRIFDIRGLSHRPVSSTSTSSSSESVTPKVKTTPSIIVHGIPFQDYLRLKTAEMGGMVGVRAYTDGWEKGSEIVKDAKTLCSAWEKRALEERGTLDRSEPQKYTCSAVDWTDIDEGIDVAKEIANVDANQGRSEPGVTLWQAYRFETQVIGILITEHTISDGENHQLGIRWLVGHPTIRGAGTVLMAKADELHRSPKYNQYPMHVTAAASSVEWYKKKGFVKKADATCNDDENDTPCGCAIMQKPSPKL